jgi:hypothetical protein
MAGIPMYYGIPTFGSVEAKMAEDRMKVLKTAEAEIDLEDYKKSKELMKKNALKEDAIKKLAESKINEPIPVPTMNKQEDSMLSYQTQDTGNRQGPTGIDQTPTEYATAPTTDVNPTSPFGTYEQRGAESPANMPYGFGGAIPKDYKSPEQALQTQVEADSGQEQPTPTTTEGQPKEQVPVQGYNQPSPPQEVPVTQVPNNIGTRAKKATLDFTEANDQVESAYNLAEAFKREGLLKPYQKQLEVAGKLEEARTMAQARRITATKDVMEMTGRLAGSYVEVAKRTNDPVELERAWQSTLMLLEMNGIPSDKLRTITDPRVRLAIAEKYSDASMSAAKKLELEYKRLNIVNQNEKAKAAQATRDRLASETISHNAWKRDLGERKFAKEELTTFINEGQKRVNSLQTDLKLKETKLLELRKSNIYIDSSGIMMDDESRAREIPLLEQEVKNLQTEIALEEDKLKAYTAKLKPGAKDTTTTSTENVTAPPQEVIQDTIKALNANPSKALLDHVKAKFKEAYPGLEFEKYIKVNPAKYK